MGKTNGRGERPRLRGGGGGVVAGAGHGADGQHARGGGGGGRHRVTRTTWPGVQAVKTHEREARRPAPSRGRSAGSKSSVDVQQAGEILDERSPRGGSWNIESWMIVDHPLDPGLDFR